jgi:hypothetical protein
MTSAATIANASIFENSSLAHVNITLESYSMKGRIDYIIGSRLLRLKSKELHGRVQLYVIQNRAYRGQH